MIIKLEYSRYSDELPLATVEIPMSINEYKTLSAEDLKLLMDGHVDKLREQIEKAYNNL